MSTRRFRGTIAAIAAIAILGGGVAAAANLVGTNGDDRLVGTKRADDIRGLAGDDLIRGRKGRDFLEGGRGADLILGGRSRDVLKGRRGHDRLRGGRGNDRMRGGLGRDEYAMRNGVQLGSPGDDIIWARDGRVDEINCGAGFDIAYVGPVEDGVYDCEVVRRAP